METTGFMRLGELTKKPLRVKRFIASVVNKLESESTFTKDIKYNVEEITDDKIKFDFYIRDKKVLVSAKVILDLKENEVEAKHFINGCYYNTQDILSFEDLDVNNVKMLLEVVLEELIKNYKENTK